MNERDLISSFRNPLIKRLRRLRQKKYRVAEGVGFVEGIRVVMTAFETAPDLIDTIIYAPGLLSSTVALNAIAGQEKRNSRVVAVSTELFRGISKRDNPTGLGAIIRSPLIELDRLPLGNPGIYVALEDIGDPGHLGTILRTMDAAGAAGCILVGQTTDVTHPSTLKASMGSVFTVPLAAVAVPAELITWGRNRGCQIVATSAAGEINFWQAPLKTPLLLLMGSEQQGLSPGLRQLADLSVLIPMWGKPSSLNLSVATGLLLYEIRRRSSNPS